MEKLKRFADWRTRLNAVINERRNTPFEWGQHDCALWAAVAVNAMTGDDFAKDAIGSYTTEIGAYKCLSKIYGTDSLKEVFSSRFEEVHISSARPGDLVYKNSNLFGFD